MSVRILNSLKLKLCLVVVVPALAEFPPCRADDLTSLQADGSTGVVKSLQEGSIDDALERLGELVAPGIPLKSVFGTALPSANAGVDRVLAQMRPEDRFDLLKAWTLPDAERRGVRILATPVPIEAPPKVFARVLSERPRETSFSVASVGPMSGFCCTGWTLVQAADEIGRLGGLRADLQRINEQDVEGALELKMLADVAGSRGDLDRVRSYLTSYATEIESRTLDHNALVVSAIACASMKHSSLRDPAIMVLGGLAQKSGGDGLLSPRSFFRFAHAAAIQSVHGEAPADALFRNRFRYWVPVSVQTARGIEQGQRLGVWLKHEQHVLHLAGGEADILFCRFPLVGNFELTCQTQEGGAVGTDGGLVYGGLHFQALGRTDTLTIWDADLKHSIERVSPFARFGSQPVFNSVSIRSQNGSSTFESNGHPGWVDNADAMQSPWVGLRSAGSNRPVFRNVKLVGQPAVPQEVRLASGDNLRGWQSGFFERSQPSFVKPSRDAAADWRVDGGVIQSRSCNETSRADEPSLLQYQRPLLSNESIKYEFLHDGSEVSIHPAFGRVAFLLQPTGVRVRWITTGRADWTALPADNAVLEPLYRRGPRSIQPKTNEWNRVSVERTDRDVSLSLNGEVVYVRPTDGNEILQFGLYRSSCVSEASVRNVVLTGDWPEKLPDDFVTDVLATWPR